MPFLLKGEDRSWGGNDLFIDLIPSTSWFTNVRSCIRPCDWNRLRRLVYDRANGKCECCNAIPANWGGSLEAHERWHYNNRNGVQKLMRVIALCKMCHTATHMGLADIRGTGDRARAHLMRVTKMDKEDLMRHSEVASRIWSDRSKRKWKLDLSIITDSGYELKQNKITNKKKKSCGEKKKITCLRMDISKEHSTRLLGTYQDSVSGNKIYRVELTVYCHLIGEAAKGEYWWLRRCSCDGISVNDQRMPCVSASKRLHIACKLHPGRYLVGCVDILPGLKSESTEAASCFLLKA
jgi:hypothetical protein